MNSAEITKTQKFWESFRNIPIHQDICFNLLTDTSIFLEKYRDNFTGIDPETLTPEGKGDIGEIKDAVEEALSLVDKALCKIKSVENLTDNIKGRGE